MALQHEAGLDMGRLPHVMYTGRARAVACPLYRRPHFHLALKMKALIATHTSSSTSILPPPPRPPPALAGTSSLPEQPPPGQGDANHRQTTSSTSQGLRCPEHVVPIRLRLSRAHIPQSLYRLSCSLSTTARSIASKHPSADGATDTKGSNYSHV